MSESIYTLVKRGYGTKTEVSKYIINEYFDILLKELMDTIREMRAANIEWGKIADELKMNIDDLIELGR